VEIKPFEMPDRFCYQCGTKLDPNKIHEYYKGKVFCNSHCLYYAVDWKGNLRKDGKS
jgi:hypothetical protein